MKNVKNITAAVMAHADAGKTTLSEALLCLSGKIKSPGRVDRGDSNLDTHELERKRGISIFSKEAVLESGGRSFYLIDTPGHQDFSAEAERSLNVLDFALLVISGSEGVQARTERLWQLLLSRRIPVFIFVSKMDLPNPGEENTVRELCRKLSPGCVNFNLPEDELCELCALCSESATEEYLSTGSLKDETIRELIGERKLFPCFFGSGLKLQGVSELLEALGRYAPAGEMKESFAASVYKIGRGSKGERLSFVKITGGSLKPRDTVKYKNSKGEIREEKINSIRLYTGEKFINLQSAEPGQVCALTGLSETMPGTGLGAEEDISDSPSGGVMRYRIILPQGTDAAQALPKLRLLQEEDPALNIRYWEKTGEISVELMGQVQCEVFISLVKSRFDMDITLDTGSIMYKETLLERCEGVGHFEPLRHYAEVHLLMEPLPPGSGIHIDSLCPEDELDRNWQRLILSHIAEKEHLGPLTGSPITDMRISLVSGRAHIKHTEGGDFRQAVYRGIRQGLMGAKMQLLEPWAEFEIELPTALIGRAISDIRTMHGEFSSPEELEGKSLLKGQAPLRELNGYSALLRSYSGGRGSISLRGGSYRPCARQEEIISKIGYDAERDVENTADSVFCAHGAGFTVKWDKVSEYMHLESFLNKKESPQPEELKLRRQYSIDERELERIMEREFGPIKRPQYTAPQINSAPGFNPARAGKKNFIIVDGYNLIFASPELKAQAAENLDLARESLKTELQNYCGFTGAELVLVFDGFRTRGNPGSREEAGNIRLAYTKDGQTADAYIEALADEIGKNYNVRVITSDNLIRLSALRSGVLRSSSKEFLEELDWARREIGKILAGTAELAHLTRLKDGKG